MANLPISVSLNWKPLVVGFLVLIGCLYYFSGHLTSFFWKPKIAQAKTMLKTGYVKIGDVENAIFYQRIIPENAKLKVLFLHGQRFTSEDWKKINTLEFLAKKGFHVMAIDLPTYGKSQQLQEPKSPSDKAKFLNDFMDKTDYNNAVLVVPSMSGSYAMPFIFEGENAKKLKGFVPVAPVGTDSFKDEVFKKLALPTMAVYGQNDNLSFVPGAIEKFKLIPNAEIKKIDNAGHACYLDSPGEFHSLMESFLKKLQKS